MAKLSELLREDEHQELKRISSYGTTIDINKEIKELNVAELSRISLMLIESEYNGVVPDCILSAEAIKILTQRAKEKRVAIF